jgi:uncharacterized protein (DUF305 family)
VSPAAAVKYAVQVLTGMHRLAVVLLTVAAAACHAASKDSAPPIVQPGAPGSAGRVIDAAAAADLSSVAHTPADVRFMQGMIAHHAQALEMTALVASRTRREAMGLLARRIEISQADEIRMMQAWLRARGEEAPSPHGHHGHGALMPGMLTPEEMGRLAAAQGAAFDRLFLELMIKHHAGALTMVDDLFAQPGAGQEPDVFAFASDVEADQRMEIERMGAMLKELQQ